MIWVTLSPDSTVDIDAFLSGYGEMLESLRFDEAHVVGRQELAGPNWEVAYDGYRDFYHLPILHRKTFGPNYAFQPDYYGWGPHVRVVAPKGFERLAGTPEDQWTDDSMTGGVWTIFPNVSIAGDTRTGFMVSQMFPGATPGESHTIQSFLRFAPAEKQDPAELAEHMQFMKTVVADEDYYTGFRQQKALATGAKEHVLFGRNEGGGQLFHRWIDELPALLRRGIQAPSRSRHPIGVPTNS